MDDKQDQHKYQKDKGSGFKINTTDPIQDIMSEDELKDAENRIEALIEQKNDENEAK